MEQVMAAIAFAAVKHEGQYRDGVERVPYIVHPISVVRRLCAATLGDVEILMAAALHDVVEDCGVSLDEIEERFSARVASLVGELSVLPGVQDAKAAQLEHAAHMHPDAALIKLADRIDNLLGVPFAGWPVEKAERYADHSAKLGAILQRRVAEVPLHAPIGNVLLREFGEALDALRRTASRP